MNTFSDDHGQKCLDELTGYAYPQIEPIEGAPDRFRRKWIVRVEKQLPAPSLLHAEFERLQLAATEAVVEAQGEVGRRPVNLPTVRATRGDDTHVVVAIECPVPAAAAGDSAAIATWTVLRGVDGLWGVEDLEGIPRKHWFFLR